jgi:hypothetical protein
VIAKKGGDTGLPIDRAAQHWMRVLLDLGPMADGKPQSWAEIKAFAEATGKAELGQEVELLHKMCHAYCEGRMVIGADVFGIAPSEGQKIERQSHPSP